MSKCLKKCLKICKCPFQTFFYTYSKEIIMNKNLMKRNNIEQANIELLKRTDSESIRNKFNEPEVKSTKRKEYLSDKLINQLKKNF